ncbi:hypothetical protein [Bradyrhizobium nanningense]|uniref:hypothetical protein n=1 Tax=Bradyrhizobium nanningense TaxID=1325118 RepID=UPI003D3235D0
MQGAPHRKDAAPLAVYAAGEYYWPLSGARARLQHTHSEEAALYHCNKVPGQLEPQRLTFVPWFGWGNRDEGKMRIWINER